jgi:hypothetical protein
LGDGVGRTDRQRLAACHREQQSRHPRPLNTRSGLEDVDDEGDDEQYAHDRPDDSATSHAFSFLEADNSFSHRARAQHPQLSHPPKTFPTQPREKRNSRMPVVGVASTAGEPLRVRVGFGDDSAVETLLHVRARWHGPGSLLT